MTESKANQAWRGWIEEARSADILEVALSLGCRLKKASADENVGPCPACGGTDRFSVNQRKGCYNCRGSSDKKTGGDVIALVEHVTGCSFLEAVERITGKPRPDRSRDETVAERNARLQANAERLALARERDLEEQIRQEKHELREDEIVAGIIDRSVPISDTYAEAYLLSRGLSPPRRLTADLRFVPELEYWGLRDNGSGSPSHLATLPALIAIIRNHMAMVTGVQITYLDPGQPRKWTPPNPHINRVKKIRGHKQGSMIRLGRITEWLAIAEGWENALAWWQLGMGPEDVSLAAAVDLGNLAGRATGTCEHPKLTDQDGRKRRIQNGKPDPNHPGVILPRDMGIKGVILLADADSESYATAATLNTARQRFKAQGLMVSVAWPAAAGLDFNDVLLAQLAVAGAQQNAKLAAYNS